MAPIADEQLLAAHRSGQSGALDQLLTRYQDRVFQFVIWRTGATWTEAQDLAQDVFLQVCHSSDSFGGHSRFRTWLYAVAGHVCSRWLRDASRRRDRTRAGSVQAGSVVLPDVPDESPGALDVIQRRERDTAIRAAIETLASKQRIALLLRDWEGLSYDEMAAVLEIPTGTVKSRVHSARLALAPMLAPILGREADA